MARDTPNFGFHVWDLETDDFDHIELAQNWDKLDTALLRYPTGVQVVTNLIVDDPNGPRGPLAAGNLAMTGGVVNSFRPQTLIRYDGSVWRAVSGVELMPAIPTTDNYLGRIVLLTGNDVTFGFSAGELARNVDGGNSTASWTSIGGLTKIASGGISGLQTQGDIYFATAARGPVFVDRTTSNKYRLYMQNGELYSERVT